MQGVSLWTLGISDNEVKADILTALADIDADLRKNGLQLCLKDKYEGTCLPVTKVYARGIVTCIKVYRDALMIEYTTEKHEDGLYIICLIKLGGEPYCYEDAKQAWRHILGQSDYTYISTLYKRLITEGAVKKIDRENLIWTSEVIISEDAKKECIASGYAFDMDEAERYLTERPIKWMDEERSRLSEIRTRGSMVAIATIERNGTTRMGYKEYNSRIISDIFNDDTLQEGNMTRIYVKNVDLCVQISYPDGVTNYILREVSNRTAWEFMKQHITDNKPITLKEIQLCTSGLGKYIRPLYKW